MKRRSKDQPAEARPTNSPARQHMSSPAPQFKNSPAPQYMNSPAPQFKNSPKPISHAAIYDISEAAIFSSPKLQFRNSPAVGAPQFRASLTVTNLNPKRGMPMHSFGKVKHGEHGTNGDDGVGAGAVPVGSGRGHSEKAHGGRVEIGQERGGVTVEIGEVAGELSSHPTSSTKTSRHSRRHTDGGNTSSGGGGRSGGGGGWVVLMRSAMLNAMLVAAATLKERRAAALSPWTTIPAVFSDGSTWEYSCALLQMLFHVIDALVGEYMTLHVKYK
ncbi:hypothetical protein V8G54_029645 [Vigna mungo]|uniref:Uncharacterized protein n=1 Tax=Vigna mungo TaxID=3915 RepID=A0AAQ3MTT4_VIGMU